MNFFSQHGQDRFLFDYFFRGKRGGRFVEVGGAGAATSHARAFEASMGWTGHRLDDTARLSAALIADEIDYLAVGARGAEFLQAADFSRAAVVSIAEASPATMELMTGRGYELVARIGPDSFFKRRDVDQLPQVSVICAVWHGDPQRFELLEGHAANLAAQTVPVEPIYVFDGGDQIPSWLTAPAVSLREDLTIYQAWNAALSLVATPLVMNLNLDDRLGPDAIEILARELTHADTAGAGGDWKVCYSQAETDAVEPCYPAESLPFVRLWPPKPGSFGRLGCGTHNFYTFGPATMWRMEAHLAVPRYPWRFAEGTLIRCAGDLAWWRALQNVVRGKIVSVPMIIGNYHSHPSEQAEFRKPPYDEIALMQDVGVART